MELSFYKYQGTGNDFVIFDNRKGEVVLSQTQIKHLCDRKFGIGADGLMLLCNKEGYDFEMIYYNADGSPSTMCGNGGRCLVQFAHSLGIHKSNYHFLAVDGDHEAEIDQMNKTVRLKMQDVNEVEEHVGYSILNTGSPHYVKFDTDVRHKNIIEEAREIRFSNTFKGEGININFVETISSYEIYVRTYERGVEDETLSCGTGVTAAALMSAHNDVGFNEVEVQTNGGKLSVEFNKVSDEVFTDIYLCGPATFVFKGTINRAC
jgi:diaminopimelate epimerase